jgi:hypothetical protein
VRQSKTLSCERCLLADLDGQGLLRRLCDAVSELPYR